MAFEPAGPPAERILWQKEEESLKAYILFCNTTRRIINLYWIDEFGFIRYHTSLAPGHQVKTNTYTNHSWIFPDIDSNELMCVGNFNRYWPMKYRILDPHNPLGMIYYRKEVRIQYPLRSLRENCLCRIVNTLNPLNPIVAVNIIERHISIPNILKYELKRRLRRPLGTEFLTEDWVKILDVRYNLPRDEDRSFLQ